MQKTLPDFSFEQKYWDQGYDVVIGIDEVGRGALAGPVTVGAVCLCKPDSEYTPWLTSGINDSKKLTPLKREHLSNTIQKNCCRYAIASSGVGVINEKGIVYAVNQAMIEAVTSITSTLPAQMKVFLLIDAFYIKNFPAFNLNLQEAIISGDQKSLSIAAASIIAKVQRDTLMEDLSGNYPHYEWHINKGYGTQKHREAIKKHRPNMIHRNLYIRNIVVSP